MKKILSLAAAFTVGATLVHATSINFGFESGDFNGWTVNGGPAEVVSSYTAVDSDGNVTDFTAPEGDYFALITGGLGEGIATTLSRTFSLAAGQVLAGFAGFSSDDYPWTNDGQTWFGDYGRATLTFGSDVTELFFADAGSVPVIQGTTGWVSWNYTALVAGDYTLTYSAANVGDNLYNSHAFFDAGVSVPDTASTLGLLSLGLVGLFAARRYTGAA